MQLESYNYNCTIHLFQLQIRFYNCGNCDQLHVKICPAWLTCRVCINLRPGSYPLDLWGNFFLACHSYCIVLYF